MSLYQEVRPNSLDSIVGNGSTVGGLRSLISKTPENRNHSIIFKGPTGCGKTTLARFLAGAFGATDISTFEYNTANTRGIDTIREISNNVELTSLDGSPKVYIFDEAHRLTSEAQDALLKLMEDGGVKCYFILCTTSPESLTKTLRNRCQEYEVNLLSEAEIKTLLTKVCGIKELLVNNDLIEAIAYTCGGSPRAALVSLEQVVGMEFDEALELLVKGTDKDAGVIDLCKLLVMYPEKRRERWKDVIQTYNKITEDSELIRRSIMTFIFNRLKVCDSMSDAEDMTRVLSIFSTSTFYGGKPMLGTLVARACFEV
jgi:DNA polymerase III gamma/tau subunit